MVSLLSKYGHKAGTKSTRLNLLKFSQTLYFRPELIESYLEQLKLPGFDKKYNLHFFNKFNKL